MNRTDIGETIDTLPENLPGRLGLVGLKIFGANGMRRLRPDAASTRLRCSAGCASTARNTTSITIIELLDDVRGALDERRRIQIGLAVHAGHDDGGDRGVRDDVLRRLFRRRQARPVGGGPVLASPRGFPF
jgi:hypothetical protein